MVSQRRAAWEAGKKEEEAASAAANAPAAYDPFVEDPTTRDISSIQREFSNDAEKEAYLERIRQAQKNAAAGAGK